MSIQIATRIGRIIVLGIETLERVMATVKKPKQEVSASLAARLEESLHQACANLQAAEIEMDSVKKKLHMSVMNQSRSPDEVLANIERFEASFAKWFSSRAAVYVARSTMQGLGILKEPV